MARHGRAEGDAGRVTPCVTGSGNSPPIATIAGTVGAEEEVTPVDIKKRVDFLILPRDPKAAHLALRQYAASRDDIPDDEPVGEDEQK